MWVACMQPQLLLERKVESNNEAKVITALLGYEVVINFDVYSSFMIQSNPFSNFLPDWFDCGFYHSLSAAFLNTNFGPCGEINQ